MKVLVAFEFEDLDPNCEDADQLINEIGEECETMGIAFDASACYIDNAFLVKQRNKREEA
jgi:hypothetical protein